jgi:hypothetical protein
VLGCRETFRDRGPLRENGGEQGTSGGLRKLQDEARSSDVMQNAKRHDAAENQHYVDSFGAVKTSFSHTRHTPRDSTAV